MELRDQGLLWYRLPPFTTGCSRGISFISYSESFFLRALVAEIADKNNDVWIRDSSDILLYEI